MQAAFLPRIACVRPLLIKDAACRPRPSWLALLAACLLFTGCQKDDSAATAHARDAQISAALDAANRQLADGQTAAALTALENLRSANPDRYDIVESLAYAQAHTGQLAQAAALFATAASNDPSRRALFIYAAGMEASANDHAGAVQEYRAYLVYFPHDAPGWRSLARELRTINQPQPALDAFLESLKWTPGNQPSPADAAAIGQLFLQLGNPVQAATWLHQALQLQPDDDAAAQARLGLLALAVQKQDWAAADKLFADLDANAAGRSALAASPLATTREQLRQWRASRDAVQHEQDAANAAAAQRAAALASLANSTGDTSANPATPPIVTFASNSTTKPTPNPAVTSANTTATIASNSTAAPAANLTGPDNTNTPAALPDPLILAAKNAADAHQYADAIRLYWKALGKDDSSPDTWLALGQVYLANKQYPDAASVAQEAIRRDATNPVYTLFYLQVEKSSQTPDKYQTELLAAYDQFPANADLALELAAIYTQHGDNRDATAVLNDYLHRALPNDPRRQDAQDALANLPASPAPAKSP